LLQKFQQRVQSDPGNADWQRGLSLSYVWMCNVQKAQGDLAAALKSYREHALSRAAMRLTDQVISTLKPIGRLLAL
jgi:hypothetical protein